MDVAAFRLVPLRFGLAVVFAYTGTEKLVDAGANAAIAAFIGVPAPTAVTIAIGVLESVAALALLAGYMVRTAAAGASLLMVVVLATLKVPGPFWSDGWGLDLAVLAGTLTLVLAGPGRPTLSTILSRHVPDPDAWLWSFLDARR